MFLRRDALAFNVLQWVWWLHEGKKIGFYCSDVSGAFDLVPILEKLQRNGVTGKVFKVLSSWLEE